MNEEDGVYISKALMHSFSSRRFPIEARGIYYSLCCLADRSTGIWRGNAVELAANFPAGNLNVRRARYVLEKLESGGYIKRFAVRRSRSRYPILLDQYLCTSGSRRGMMTNAAATTDWRHPAYEIPPDDPLGVTENLPVV